MRGTAATFTMTIAIFLGAGCNLDPGSSWFRDADAAAVADDGTVQDDTIPTDADTVVTTDAPPKDTDAATDDTLPDIEETDDGTTPSDEDIVTTGSVIEDIQRGKVATDTAVSFEAMVTALEFTLDAEYNPTGIKGLFVSVPELATALPWNGIYVFIKTPAEVEDYHVGDLLEVAGTYTEYYDASQVQDVTISPLGTATVPTPALIEDPARVATPFESNGTDWLPTTDHGPDGEMWESCLVEVHDVEVVNQDLGHGQWAVTGGLVIDKKLFYYPGARTVGTKFDRITGILVYTYDAFKLAPRDADDVVSAE